MQVPSRAELERWFDAERADEVHFVETVASWPSLRVLDHLYAGEPATTGEVARALDMDMRDVKDRLDALERYDTVEETDDGWVTTTDRVNITLARGEGLEIDHSTGTGQEDDRTDRQSDEETREGADGGMLSGLRRFVSSLLP